MLHTTPQERLALGVTALLLAAGLGARLVRSGPAPLWEGHPAADTSHSATPRARIEQTLDATAAATATLAAGGRLDPNTATAAELEVLPRIGPALAQRIVEHRTTQGPFHSLADLDRVSGIGPALLATLAPLLTLPPAPEGGAGAGRPHARSPGGHHSAARLDVNRASAAELEALPGIGPALAGRILEWRAEHGRFQSLQDLEAVPGVGPRLVERLEPLLRAGS